MIGLRVKVADSKKKIGSNKAFEKFRIKKRFRLTCPPCPSKTAKILTTGAFTKWGIGTCISANRSSIVALRPLTAKTAASANFCSHDSSLLEIEVPSRNVISPFFFAMHRIILSTRAKAYTNSTNTGFQM